jgi:hypothetical protein
VQVEAVSHDALLCASHRVDWRFLLPDPELGRVACVGVNDEALLEALRLFSVSLASSASCDIGAFDEPFDLVVLRNPRGEALDDASGLLRPGGWLYIEVEKTGREETRATWSSRGYARALRKRGFVDVRTHVHWPDFASCRAIVPVDDAAAVRLGLGRARTKRAPLTSLAPVLAGSRQLARFVPCASVLGRSTDGQAIS